MNGLLSSDNIDNFEDIPFNVDWWCRHVMMPKEGPIQDYDFRKDLLNNARSKNMKIIVDVMAYPKTMPTTPTFRSICLSGEKKKFHKWLDIWGDWCELCYNECQPDILEIFSENNCIATWEAGVSVKDYELLLRVAREACPDATIGMGGFTLTNNFGKDWWENIIKLEVYRFFDVVCIHPYILERNLNKALNGLDELFFRVSQLGQDIYLTEFGLPFRGRHRRQSPTLIPDANPWTFTFAEHEAGIWWAQLLPLFEKYCKTTAFYWKRWSEEYLEKSDFGVDYWGWWIGVQDSEVEGLIRKYYDK